MNKIVLSVMVALIIGIVIGYGVGAFIYQNQINILKEKLNPKVLEKIKSRGKLIVGTSADWPPFEWIDNGQVVGIDIEIARRIADKIGVELEIKDMKFGALIEALKNDMVDMIIADISPTSKRELQVDFSIPYYYTKGNVVVTFGDKNIGSVKDLYGKKIGVQLGTIQQDWAEANLKNYSTIITYDKVYPDMIFVLKRGDIDAVVISEQVANVILQKEPGLKVALYVGGPSMSAVAVKNGAEDLKYVINQVIEELLESGEMQNIFDKEIDRWLKKT